MAVDNGYTTGIRSALNQKGISNDQITYDPSKGVMVNGTAFYKPEKNYNGTTYTTANKFNQAWSDYTKNQAMNNTGAVDTTGAAATTGYNPYESNSQIKNNPYSSQTDQIINQLLNYNQNQPAYDPYSSAGYAAAQAQANRAAQQSTRAAQEAFGSSGFGRSTALGERVTGINNAQNEYLMTQVVPQLQAQEQARRQQEYNNMISALSPLMGQQDRADNLVQQDFNNRITESGVTGNYQNGEAEQLINHILSLKQQAEATGLPNLDVQSLSAQADQDRNRLAALGYDPSLYGADVNAATAGQNKGAGSRTLAAQQQDYAQQADTRDYNENVRQYDQSYAAQQAQQQWDNAFQQGQFDFNKAQQAWENAFQDRSFEQDMKDAAASRGLQWANLNQSQKEFVANQEWREKQFEYQQGQDAIANDLAYQKAGQGEPYDYKSDPDFMADAAAMVKSPGQARTALRDNAQDYIDKYGIEGYNYLITTINK